MIRTTVLAASLALGLTAAQAAQPLTVKVYNADGNSFNVNSTLVYGEKDAMVIDAGFTRADALRIAANVLDSGKQLTTIYVSQADPDYYFGVEALKEIFPKADVVTTPAVLSKLVPKMAGKVAFWGPKMGANAPRTPVAPRALEGNTLTLEGQTIEIRGTARRIWRTALTRGFRPSKPSSATLACSATPTCGRQTPKPPPSAPPGSPNWTTWPP